MEEITDTNIKLTIIIDDTHISLCLADCITSFSLFHTDISIYSHSVFIDRLMLNKSWFTGEQLQLLKHYAKVVI